MWGHIKNSGKQKPRKLMLLSFSKEEENRIELLTALNQKLQKSKPRKSRNACKQKINSWLFSTFFSCVASKIIHVRKYANARAEQCPLLGNYIIKSHPYYILISF